MQEKIDWAAAMSGERPVSSDGRDMRVLCFDAAGRLPVVCVDAYGDTYRFDLGGEYLSGTISRRLTQSPKVIEWTEYFVVLGSRDVSRFTREADAINWLGGSKTPIVKVNYRICGDEVTVSGGTK